MGATQAGPLSQVPLAVPVMCANAKCWGFAVGGHLCRRCAALREASLIVGLCFVGSVLIVVAMKVLG